MLAAVEAVALAAVEAVALAAVEAEERVKPLSGQAMLITLGLIVVVCAAILLAGFGYFSSSDD